MVKVLFICHGNICRSPMAEYLLRDMVRRQGLAAQFQIASAATSREEIGNDVYPPARAELRAHGIPVGHRAAVQVTPRDYAQDTLPVEYRTWDTTGIIQSLSPDQLKPQ